MGNKADLKHSLLLKSCRLVTEETVSLRGLGSMLYPIPQLMPHGGTTGAPKRAAPPPRGVKKDFVEEYGVSLTSFKENPRS